jgi:hypothetical protein
MFRAETWREFPQKRHAGEGENREHGMKNPPGLNGPFYECGTVATEKRLSRSLQALGLCGQWLPELHLIPVQVVDPGEATVGFIHSSVVNLHPSCFKRSSNASISSTM